MGIGRPFKYSENRFGVWNPVLEDSDASPSFSPLGDAFSAFFDSLAGASEGESAGVLVVGLGPSREVGFSVLLDSGLESALLLVDAPGPVAGALGWRGVWGADGFMGGRMVFPVGAAGLAGICF